MPVGREADGTPEDPEDTRARTRFDVEPVVGITVIEDDPEKLPVDRFTLAYEGVIPGTDSRSGQHGGVTESDDGDTWALLDYDRDFCRAGIEVGVADVFYADDDAAPVIGPAVEILPRVARAACIISNHWPNRPKEGEIKSIWTRTRTFQRTCQNA